MPVGERAGYLTGDVGYPFLTGRMTTTMSWAGFAAAEPSFADTVRRRFAAYRHHVLATLRQDGSPRLCGLEATFRFDELWLGMMPHSRKALDLRRDPRFALHANPGAGVGVGADAPDAEAEKAAGGGGDVRLSGLAVEVDDPEVMARFAEEVLPPEPFGLFRVEVAEVVRTRVEGGELVLSVWRPDGGLRSVRPM